jgi:hypothetical protein
MEVSGTGTGKFLGADAFVASSSIGTMQNGVFSGEVYASITTRDGQTIFCKANAVGYPSGNGKVSRAAFVLMAQSEKFMRLNKAILFHEYETDETDISNNWTGKSWSGSSLVYSHFFCGFIVSYYIDSMCSKLGI